MRTNGRISFTLLDHDLSWRHGPLGHKDMSIDELNSVEVGERLRVAREAAGITQAAAAIDINVARTTLIAIEKGQRRVRIDELKKLARLYAMSVNALLRRESGPRRSCPSFQIVVHERRCRIERSGAAYDRSGRG